MGLNRRKVVLVLLWVPGTLLLALTISLFQRRIEIRWLRESLLFVRVLCIVGCVVAIDVLVEKREHRFGKRDLWLFVIIALIAWSLSFLVRFAFFRWAR
jgi:hypothetical protein